MRLKTPCLASFTAALLLMLPAAHGQRTVGDPPFTPFKPAAAPYLKPPAGQPVAILEFEDLECPLCGRAAPIVKSALDKYKIGFVRHDWLIPSHNWSRDAAICARYLQDKVASKVPGIDEQYRRDVFAAQNLIANKDDLQTFTRNWFTKHGQQMPFVVDPNGLFAAEVQADCTLGDKIGIIHTPTIVVLGPKGWTEVADLSQLYTVIDQTLAQVPAAHGAAKISGKGGSTH
jgi:protein-disulfide isomerase